MRERVDAKKLRKKYNLWGYINERFGLFFSRKRNKPFIRIWRGVDKATLFIALGWLKCIYIPKSTYLEGR